MEHNKETAPRYEGSNWDRPTVVVHRRGDARRSLERKVLTRGVKVLQLGGTMKHVKELLRQGVEVRFADELGNEALRFYPLATVDCRSMSVRAQAMGNFAKCLNDKRPRLRNGERTLSDGEAKEIIDDQAERFVKYRAEIASVTPDMMVTCPNCGTQFRVGRSMKE